ncbi:MAG: hypothetical protein KGL39_43245 [Patescibacteria group bacterium]|nr:hypothetical protein [Patescibacteria group bacterium]
MNRIGLSPAALAERRKRIHAGDAAPIMVGDWRKLWRVKMGLDEEDDLSGILPVQLGLYTEPFNLAWCWQQTGRGIEYFTGNEMLAFAWRELTGDAANDGELCVSLDPETPWMACNLDGLTITPQGERCPIDAKHVGRLDEQTMLRYTYAGVHQATVLGCDHWALSVIIGNSKWEAIYQEVDPIVQAELIAREREFWGFVERGEEPPEVAAPIAPPKPQPKLRTIRLPTEEDEIYAAMVRRDNWLPEAVRLIHVFADTLPAATKHNITREELKALVPEDVGTLEWGRFKLARDRAGSVRMSLKPMENDDG